MRILMLSDVYFPRVNGVSTSIRTFREQLTQLGHSVTLVAPAYPGCEPEPGTIRIGSHYLWLDPEDRAMRPGAVMQHAASFARDNFDVIHIQTPFIAHHTGVRLSRKLGIPAVASYHTLFEEYLYCYVPLLPKAWMRASARSLARWQCGAVDSVIVPSSAMADTLRGYGVSPSMAIIPTGVEPSMFVRGEGWRFRERYGLEPWRPLLLYVGRVAHEKNIDFLLRMMARLRERLPDAVLVIAGEGPALKGLQRLAVELDIAENVLFLGYLARDGRLQDCYRAADGFVFASRTETQGLVLLEAMAQGTPVVSTAVMGTRDVLVEGRGVLIANEDEEDFAAKAYNVLANRELRSALGQEAWEYARNWNPRALAELLAEHYAAAVSGVGRQRDLTRQQGGTC